MEENAPSPEMDEIAKRLAQLEEGFQADESTESTESTITELKAELDTLVSALHGVPQAASFDDESGCGRVTQLVKAIGQDADDVTFDSNDGRKSGGNDNLPGLKPLGQYELLEKIGEGGMGAVYKARHKKLDKIVAVKVLPAERMQDKQAVSRFEREMRAVGKLEHPNIVRAMDAGEVDGTHFLVMEYVKGIDLSDLVKRVGPLPIADACEVIRQAAVGLDDAHENNMVHRDIKPSNIMLCVGGKRKPPIVKILDMGLALLSEAHSPDAQGLTTTGQMMGTLDYMAPEQGGDSHEVDIRADIYALGASLYRLLCGQVIYHGNKFQTPVQKVVALGTLPAPPIQSRREGIPDELAAVVHAMLEKDPDARISTPEEVVVALAPFCHGAELDQLMNASGVDVPATKDSSLLGTVSNLSSPESATEPTLEREASLAPEPVKQTPTVTPAKVPDRDSRKLPPWLPKAIAGGLGSLALLAAIVFFLQTSEGTLRVEINDPSIEVQIKGTEIHFSNADKKEITIAVGKKTLIVKRGDFSFETKQLVLKKGKTTIVKVDLLTDELVVSSDGKPLDSRTVAQANTPQLARGPTVVNGAVELFPLVDLKQDVVSGNWTMSEGNLSVPKGEGEAELVLPVRVDGHYLLSLNIKRKDTPGQDPLMIDIPVGEGVAQIRYQAGEDKWLLSGPNDNLLTESSETKAWGSKGSARLMMHVGQRDSHASIQVAIRQVVVLNWRGPLASLMPSKEAKRKVHPRRIVLRQIGQGRHGSSYIFNGSAPSGDNLRMISGECQLLRPHASFAPLETDSASQLPTGPTVVNGSVDLFPLIDLKLDVVSGKWKLHEGSLSVPEGEGAAELVLPVRVEGRYLLSLSIKREKSSGNDPLMIDLPIGDGVAQLHFLPGESKWVLLDLNDNVLAESAEDLDFGSGKGIRLVIQVGSGGIRARRNLSPIFDWSGPLAPFMPSKKTTRNVHPHRIVLRQVGQGARGSSYVFNGAAPSGDNLRMMEGEFQLLRPSEWFANLPTESAALPEHPPKAGSNSPRPPGISTFHKGHGNIELLSMIDPKLDAISGRWLMSDGELSLPAGDDDARLVVPVDMAGSYLFYAEFTRENGPAPTQFVIDLPVGRGLAQICLSADKDKQWSLRDPSGKVLAESPVSLQDNPKKNPNLFILAESRDRDVRVFAKYKGVPIFDWIGTKETLLPTNASKRKTPPQRIVLHKKGQHPAFVFKSINIRMVKGEAKMVRPQDVEPKDANAPSANSPVNARSEAGIIFPERAEAVFKTLINDGKPMTIEIDYTRDSRAVNYAHLFTFTNQKPEGPEFKSVQSRFAAWLPAPAPEKDSGDEPVKTADVNIQGGHRTHIAVVSDRDELRLYVNGKGLAPLSTKGHTLAHGGYLRFGRWIAGMIGVIHQARISNGARYTKDFVPPLTLQRDQNTRALYYYTKDHGDTVKDHSGNGHDGVFLNKAHWLSPQDAATDKRVIVDSVLQAQP